MEGSKFCKVFGLLSAFIAACLAETEVELTAESNNVLVGDTISLRCYVPAWQSGFYGDWYKFGQDGKKLKLATNNDAEGSVGTDLPSFTFDIQVRAEEDGGGVDLTLTIENAETWYSGKYTCDVFDTIGKESREIDIQVLSAPTNIAMFIEDEELVSDEVKEFESFTTVSVRCEASGGNPTPMIHVMNGDMDITQYFTNSEEVERTPTDVTAFETPVGRATVSAMLKLDSTFRDKQLYCKAHTRGMPDGEVTTSKYRIEFQGTPPEIECFQTHLVLDPYSKVQFNCSVNANPPISKASVSFMLDNNITQVLDENNSKFGKHVHFEKKEDPTDAFRHYVLVTIERMTPQMFRTYTILVANDIGTAEKLVSFEKNADWVAPGSVATLSVSLVTLLSSFLMALWL